MRLKKDFILHDSGDGYVIVAVGDAAKYFHGLVHLNTVGGKIVELLKEESSEKEIIDKMMEIYDVEYEIIQEDVRKIVSQLKEAGIVE